MPKGLLKIIGISLILFTISEASKSKDKQLNFELAKRSLLEREREFFRNQPMSEDLRSFIERYKRKGQEKREKRSQNINEDSMYIINNGQLMPIRNVHGMRGAKRSDDDDNKGDVDSFTVVPLVIPLMPKQMSENKLVKTRNLNDALQNSLSNEAPLPGGVVSVVQPATTVKTESFAENVDDNDANTNNTNEDQVLHKILQDVEGLMQWKHEGSKKEGLLCNLNGSWVSDAAGMRFDICYKNSTRKKFRIHLADRIPPNEDGFLCDGNWTVFGELPFLHSGMVIALAVHEKDKHIATFIGECRVCDGSETVTGTWMVGRSSRDCKDQKASHKILSDVWKREQAHTLRKKHLRQLGLSVPNDDD